MRKTWQQPPVSYTSSKTTGNNFQYLIQSLFVATTGPSDDPRDLAVHVVLLAVGGVQ
jgi:hypothetical protein